MKSKINIIKKQMREDISHRIIFGIYYGYPDCCIIDFNTQTSKNARLRAMYCGFVICPKHARKVLLGKVRVSNLIRNRISKCKFPHQEPITVFVKSMKKIKHKIRKLNRYKKLRKFILNKKNYLK